MEVYTERATHGERYSRKEVHTEGNSKRGGCLKKGVTHGVELRVEKGYKYHRLESSLGSDRPIVAKCRKPGSTRYPCSYTHKADDFQIRNLERTSIE